MNSLKLIFVLTLSLLSVPSPAQPPSDLTAFRPQFTFAPSGFDSNDSAQVVLYGIFTDVCHKVVAPRVTVDRFAQRILIQPRAQVTQMCVDIYVNIPYTIPIDLGSLPAGRYDVMVANGKGGYQKARELPIRAPVTPSQMDEHHYAQVTEVTSRVEFDSGTIELKIQGVVPSTCLRLQSVQVNSAAGQVVDVLPILKYTPGNCVPTQTPFERKIRFRPASRTPILFNVRSAAGQAVLKVVDPRETVFTRLGNWGKTQP